MQNRREREQKNEKKILMGHEEARARAKYCNIRALTFKRKAVFISYLSHGKIIAQKIGLSNVKNLGWESENAPDFFKVQNGMIFINADPLETATCK